MARKAPRKTGRRVKVGPEVAGERAAPRAGGTGAARTLRASAMAGAPKPHVSIPRDKTAPELPPLTRESPSRWPGFPEDLQNPYEQESILSEGEEARPRKVRKAERGEIVSKRTGMHAARAGGRMPEDERGGAAFADRPWDKPIARGRPISTPPLRESNPRRKR